MSDRLVKIGGIIAVVTGLALIATGLLIVYFLPGALGRLEEEYEDALGLGLLFLSTLPPGITISWIGIILLRKTSLHSWETRMANILLVIYIFWYSTISLFAIQTPDRWLFIPCIFIFGFTLFAVKRKRASGGDFL